MTWHGAGISRAPPISLPAGWTYSDTENLEDESRDQVLTQYLADKGLSSEKKIIVYDANGTDAKAVEDYLTAKGIGQVSLYNVKQWANESSLEMEQYPGYELLVPAAHVNALIGGETPESLDQGVEYKLFDVAWGC